MGWKHVGFFLSFCGSPLLGRLCFVVTIFPIYSHTWNDKHKTRNATALARLFENSMKDSHSRVWTVTQINSRKCSMGNFEKIMWLTCQKHFPCVKQLCLYRYIIHVMMMMMMILVHNIKQIVHVSYFTHIIMLFERYRRVIFVNEWSFQWEISKR